MDLVAASRGSSGAHARWLVWFLPFHSAAKAAVMAVALGYVIGVTIRDTTSAPRKAT